MSTIKALGIPKIKALGLNNTGGIDKSQQKSLSIEYLSCEKKLFFLVLKFRIKTKNLNSKHLNEAVLNIFRGDIGRSDAPSLENHTEIIQVQATGEKVIEVYTSNIYGNTFYDKKKYYRASIGIKDEAWALSEGFVIVNKNNASSSLQGCGSEYKNKIKCTRYNGVYGPEYTGEISLKNFKNWNNLISQLVVTQEEKEILVAMSENEGNLDTVQSYDSEILSAGAMQKTVSISGEGEFPIQLYEFNMVYKEKGEKLEKCGWKVEEKNNTYIISYNGITGKDLKAYIRSGFDESNYKKYVECKPLEPIIKLLNDPDFQNKQIEDFIERLHFCLQIQPLGYNNKIGDFMKSKLGRALILDHHVNRKSHVKKCFGEALNTFFYKNPQVSKIPNNWGNNFANYESKILEIYGPLRGDKNKGYSMTNATKRYNDLKNKL